MQPRLLHGPGDGVAAFDAEGLVNWELKVLMLKAEFLETESHVPRKAESLLGPFQAEQNAAHPKNAREHEPAVRSWGGRRLSRSGIFNNSISIIFPSGDCQNCVCL